MNRIGFPRQMVDGDGWTIEVGFLVRVKNAMRKLFPDDPIGLEDIEAVLLATEKATEGHQQFSSEKP